MTISTTPAAHLARIYELLITTYGEPKKNLIMTQSAVSAAPFFHSTPQISILIALINS